MDSGHLNNQNYERVDSGDKQTNIVIKKGNNSSMFGQDISAELSNESYVPIELENKFYTIDN